MWRYTGKLERRLSDIDMFIARSEFSRRKHREFGFAPPMQVSCRTFSPAISRTVPNRRRRHGPHDRPYFLTVGRLAKIKGLDSVIRAFKRYPDADLLIVGHGEELASLKAAAEGMPNVKFVGAIPNQDLRRFYEHAIAAIMPSLGYETFGIVLIEAFRSSARR
jgi:glycosyltransferase involved in cell wall biosynthesis